MTALPPVERTPKGFPSASDLLRALLDRCTEYEQVSGIARSEISRLLTNDPSFLSTVDAGRNITIGTYERCMTRLDALLAVAALPGVARKAKGRSAHGKKKRNGGKAARKRNRRARATVPA